MGTAWVSGLRQFQVWEMFQVLGQWTCSDVYCLMQIRDWFRDKVRNVPKANIIVVEM